jgi:hypothetical protein
MAVCKVHGGMALAFNRERVVAMRAADLEIGRHPPADDPIQG